MTSVGDEVYRAAFDRAYEEGDHIGLFASLDGAKAAVEDHRQEHHISWTARTDGRPHEWQLSGEKPKGVEEQPTLVWLLGNYDMYVIALEKVKP